MRCTNKSEILFRAGREEENQTPSKWRYLSRSAQCCCWKGRGLSYLPWQRFLVTLFTCGKFCARMHWGASDEDLGSWAPRGQGLVRPWSAGELQVRNNCADHQSRHFPQANKPGGSGRCRHVLCSAGRRAQRHLGQGTWGQLEPQQVAVTSRAISTPPRAGGVSGCTRCPGASGTALAFRFMHILSAELCQASSGEN